MRHIKYGLYLIVITCISAFTSTGFAQVLEQLMKAVEGGQTSEVAALLDRGLDVNSTDRDGNTLLMLAARYGHRDVAAFLLSRKADINRRNGYGDNALLMASLKGDLPVVKMLVEARAELNPPGWAPLHYAAFGGVAPVVTYLIGKGANKDSVAPNGHTALMLAVRDGRIDAARALLFEDVDVNFRTSAGETALGIAQKREKAEMVELLRRAGARQ